MKQFSLLSAICLLTLAACAAPTPTADNPAQDISLEVPLVSIEPTPANPALEPIVVSLSLYRLLDNLDNPDPAISSQRTDVELLEILEGMNQIWGQASISFEVVYVGPLVVPPDVLRAVNTGDFGPFIDQVGDTFDVQQPGVVNGFYARQVGGPNGINPFGSRLYFVTDQPSVYDHRVSSHEVGHILGLQHIISDRDHLLSPGVNGMTLDEGEIATARHIAQSLR